MNRQLITETSLAGLRPLGVSGRWVVESWHEIDATIRTYLKPADARLLAEPVRGERGIAWFAETEGKAVPFADLPPDVAAPLVAETAARVERLTALAAQLSGDRDLATRRLGETLERALSVPSPVESRGFLYAILPALGADAAPAAIEPVLVNWGTRDDTPDARTDVLEVFLRRARAAPTDTAKPGPEPILPTDQPEDKRGQAEQPTGGAQAERGTSVRGPATVDDQTGAPVLLWLLLALLVAASFYLLLPACGLWTPFATLLGACDRSVVSVERDLAQARQRGLALEAQLAALEQDRAALPLCEVSEAVHDREQVARLDHDVHAAGGAVGEVALTLSWQGDADLDLAVICPGGARISFLEEEMTQPACGNGTLDVDANATVVVARPLENITWPIRPDSGRYRAAVTNFAGRSTGARAVPFQLRIKTGDEQVLIEGAAAPGDVPLIHLFDVR